MQIENIPFRSINWEQVPRVEYQGETGVAVWQTIEFGGLRIRVVEYSAGYVADHWCEKGHVVYCLEGRFFSEMRDGSRYELSKGMSYVVSDGLSSHRSVSAGGARLLIVDGDFLRQVKDGAK